MNTEEQYLKTMSKADYKYKPDNNEMILSGYDSKLMFIVLFLIITGFLAIFSAGAPKCIIQGTPSTFFVLRQFIWFILGFIAMWVISHINYKVLDKLSIKFAWFIINEQMF